MADKTPKLPLFSIGHIASGGQSNRMGTDKGLLTFHQKPQRYHQYDMLRAYCPNVFLSVNEQQSSGIRDGYEYLTDHSQYADSGPIAALLSCFDTYPTKNILLIGCDYPLLTVDELDRFCVMIQDKPMAFYDQSSGYFEPLLAWYPASMADRLKTFFNAGKKSLQHFLTEMNAEKYIPNDPSCMMNANSPEELAGIHSIIKNRHDQFRTFGS